MADVADTAVTIVRSVKVGSSDGRVKRTVDLAGTFTAGTAANKIKASSLKLRVIEEVTLGVLDDGSKIYPLCPSNDGSHILAMNVENATDATRGTPADITVTSPRKLRLTVIGFA